jgi:murein DD-endopeptidase MepM/ murein hydrolase activator NlpD
MLAAVIAGAALLLYPARASEAQTAATLPTLKLPLPAGTAWKVLQGYNGGTHVAGPEQYALDLVRDGGPTAGTEVLAPAAGSLWFAHAPGAGNGCASIKLDGGGGLIVQFCHIVLHRVMRPDERISAGMSLGTIGADGRVGNNGIAHLHLSMHRTPDFGVTRIPAPFSSAGGIGLEGRNLTPDGSRNQLACPGASCPGTLVSTLGSASAPTPVTSMPPASPPTPPVVNAPPAPPLPVGPVPPSAPPTPMRPAPPTPLAPIVIRPGVRAVVAGAGDGDCVNVREQPSLGGPVKTCLADGARLRVVEGPVAADGYQWWRLDGLGWAAGMYLTALAPALEPGGTARVNVGAGSCLNVRTAPAIAAPAGFCLPDGTSVRLVQGPFAADGESWWQMEGGGWLSGQYLTPEE